MFLAKYDRKRHIENEKLIAWKEGFTEGFVEEYKKTLNAERERSIQIIIETCMSLDASKEVTLQKLIEKYSLSEEQAANAIEKYWG